MPAVQAGIREERSHAEERRVGVGDLELRLVEESSFVACCQRPKAAKTDARPIAITASARGSQGARSARATIATSAAKGRRKNASRLAPASMSCDHSSDSAANARTPRSARRSAAVARRSRCGAAPGTGTRPPRPSAPRRGGSNVRVGLLGEHEEEPIPRSKSSGAERRRHRAPGSSAAETARRTRRPRPRLPVRRPRRRPRRATRPCRARRFPRSRRRATPRRGRAARTPPGGWLSPGQDGQRRAAGADDPSELRQSVVHPRGRILRPSVEWNPVITAWKRVLVLAPHTDDGEFIKGVTLARLVDGGTDVRYVALDRDPLAAGGPSSTRWRGRCARRPPSSGSRRNGSTSTTSRCAPSPSTDSRSWSS